MAGDLEKGNHVTWNSHESILADSGYGWNRHKNCGSFKLDWDSLSDKDKKTIQKILDRRGG